MDEDNHLPKDLRDHVGGTSHLMDLALLVVFAGGRVQPQLFLNRHCLSNQLAHVSQLVLMVPVLRSDHHIHKFENHDNSHELDPPRQTCFFIPCLHEFHNFSNKCRDNHLGD